MQARGTGHLLKRFWGSCIDPVLIESIKPASTVHSAPVDQKTLYTTYKRSRVRASERPLAVVHIQGEGGSSICSEPAVEQARRHHRDRAPSASHKQNGPAIGQPRNDECKQKMIRRAATQVMFSGVFATWQYPQSVLTMLREDGPEGGWATWDQSRFSDEETFTSG